MIALPQLYAVAGLCFAAFAWLGVRDRSNSKRWGNAGFWGLMALSMLAGDAIGDFGNGLLVLALVAIAGSGQLGRGTTAEIAPAERGARALRHGNRLFALALVIPATALLGTFLLPYVPHWVDPKQVTLASLAAGALLALVIGMVWLRTPLRTPLEQGRRLLDSVGWAALLPQMLAALGAIFALTGVGTIVGSLIEQVIPANSLFFAVLAYGLGMALFTIIMGNAFAAFPVMLAAIGMPLLINIYHGDPAIICAIGMLCGFCGTLMTPMAANFNLVPAALLELDDRYGVIRAQIGTALPLLLINIALLYGLGFQ